MTKGECEHAKYARQTSDRTFPKGMICPYCEPPCDTQEKARLRHGWGNESLADVYGYGFDNGVAWSRSEVLTLLKTFSPSQGRKPEMCGVDFASWIESHWIKEP